MAIQGIFTVSGDPFSISIHNERGRYWLQPFDNCCDNVIKHNKDINWTPYRGEPEQLAQIFQSNFKFDIIFGS